MQACNSKGCSEWSGESVPGVPALSVPDPPTVTNSIPGNRKLTISWVPPVSDGGSFITGWVIRAVNESGDVISKVVAGNGGTTSGVIDGLTNGDPDPTSLVGAYKVTVSAVNAIGEGRPSDAYGPRLSTKPVAGAPEPARNVVAAAGPTASALPPGVKGQARITWDEPLDDGGSSVTGYRVTSNLPTSGTTGTYFAPTDVSGNITGLIAFNLPTGTPITFYVQACNAKGCGTPSLPSNALTLGWTPEKIVANPVNSATRPYLRGVGILGQGELSWIAPANNGSAITGYEIKLVCTTTATTTTPCSRNGETTTTGPGTAQTLTGQPVPPISVAYTVTPINAYGKGPASDTSNADILSDIPQPPTNLVATPTGIQGQMKVTFTAPVNTGGRPIDHYIVDARKELTAGAAFAGGSLHSTTVTTNNSTTVLIDNLPVGYFYKFFAQTVNTGDPGFNTSARSAGSSPAVALTAVPNPPTAVSAASPGFATGGFADITYTPAVQPAGTPAVSSYTITCVSCSPVQTFTNSTVLTGIGDPPAITYQVGGPSGSLPNGVPLTFTVHATNSVGSGAESVQSAPLTILGTPSAPLNVTATATGATGTIQLSWSPPASNGGLAISEYRVDNITCVNGAGPLRCNNTITGISGSATTYLVTGLTNGQAYRFRMRAVNAQGESVRSAFAPTVATGVIPVTNALAPTNVVASVPASPGLTGTGTVTWTAPTDNGGTPITGYRITASTGQVKDVVGVATTSVTFSDLTDGASTTFTVKATNAVGFSPDSATSNAIVPGYIPGAPTGVDAVATKQPGEVKVTWTAAPAHGPALTQNEVVAHCACAADGTTGTTTGSATAYTMVGLPNGEVFTFTVQATNSFGNGPVSDPSGNATPIGPPTVPLNVVATRTSISGVVNVTWDPPADVFGSPVLNYIVRTSVAPDKVVLTNQTTYTGLADGVPVTFTVQAVNDAGAGPVSAASAPVSPWGAPDAPANLVATPTGITGQVHLAWDVPDDHTSAITGYTIRDSEGGTHLVGPGSSTDISGLVSSTSYSFIISATNAAGEGAYSAPSNAVTPAGKPDAPTPVTAAVSGPGAVTLTFPTPNGNGAAITGYTVTITCAGGTCIKNGTQEAITSGGTVTGLGEGGTASFSVTASNSSGVGPAATSNTVTIPSRPSVPTGPNLTTNGIRGSVTANWTAPADGGLPITSYVVTSPQTATVFNVPAPATSFEFPRLTFADNTGVGFVVRAVNAVGQGPATATSAVLTTPTTPPGPNAGITVVNVPGQPGTVDVSWTAPTNNSRSPIVQYSVLIGVTPTNGLRRNDVVTTTLGSGATTLRISGLTSGGTHTYTFRIGSVNDVGLGTRSPANLATILVA